MSGVSLHGGLAHRKASTYTREFTSQTNIPRRNIKYITCRRLVRLEDKARVRVSNSGRGKGFFLSFSPKVPTGTETRPKPPINGYRGSSPRG